MKAIENLTSVQQYVIFEGKRIALEGGETRHMHDDVASKFLIQC
jgi:hypothetical protein